MPPASKRKREGGTSTAGSKSKKTKKKPKKTKYSSGSDDDIDDLVQDSGADEGEWVVEEVQGKRIRNGVTEYFLKWKDWPVSTNTWEPIENLQNCPELVEAYEAKQKRKEMMEEKNGFDKGYVARAVCGVVQLEGGTKDDLCYIVDWEDIDRMEKVPAAIVREKIPQEVIKFLQGKIKWSKKSFPEPDEDEIKTSSVNDKDSTTGSVSKMNGVRKGKDTDSVSSKKSKKSKSSSSSSSSSDTDDLPDDL